MKSRQIKAGKHIHCIKRIRKSIELNLDHAAQKPKSPISLLKKWVSRSCFHFSGRRFILSNEEIKKAAAEVPFFNRAAKSAQKFETPRKYLLMNLLNVDHAACIIIMNHQIPIRTLNLRNIDYTYLDGKPLLMNYDCYNHRSWHQSRIDQIWWILVWEPSLIEVSHDSSKFVSLYYTAWTSKVDDFSRL